MSCDLSFNVEVKVAGTWHTYKAEKSMQDYKLFGIIAGVREPEFQLFAPKGLPDDISVVTQIRYKRYKQDAHGQTWLTPEEFGKVIERFAELTESSDYAEKVEKRFDYLFGGSIKDFNNYRESFPKEIEDVRIVIWFDN